MIDYFGLYTNNLNLVDVGYLENNIESFEDKGKNGFTKYGGRIRNMNFLITDHGMFIQGSPATFTYGNNFKTLKQNDLIFFMDELSHLLKCDVRQMRISRLDITDNLEMDYKPSLYKRYMGNCQHMERVNYGKNGLQYKNASRKMLLYDKIIEAKVNKHKIPHEYRDENLWRFEYQLLTKVNNYLDGCILTRVDDLLDKDNFINLINVWEKQFKKIELIEVDAMRQVEFNPKMKYENHLIASGIIGNGGLGIVLDDLNDQFSLGNLTKRKVDYSKKKCKKIMSDYQIFNSIPFSIKDELIKKLELKAEENRDMI